MVGVQSNLPGLSEIASLDNQILQLLLAFCKKDAIPNPLLQRELVRKTETLHTRLGFQYALEILKVGVLKYQKISTTTLNIEGHKWESTSTFLTQSDFNKLLEPV